MLNMRAHEIAQKYQALVTHRKFIEDQYRQNIVLHKNEVKSLQDSLSWKEEIVDKNDRVWPLSVQFNHCLNGKVKLSVTYPRNQIAEWPLQLVRRYGEIMELVRDFEDGKIDWPFPKETVRIKVSGGSGAFPE